MREQGLGRSTLEKGKREGKLKLENRRRMIEVIHEDTGISSECLGTRKVKG